MAHDPRSHRNDGDDTVVLAESLPPRVDDPAQTTVGFAFGQSSDTPRAATSAPQPAHLRYIIVGTVGKGGMGTVHLAEDTELMRRVALKQLAPEIESGGARQRFMREVQITAQLDHPHIVPVYGLENAFGQPAYAMKLVAGKTFAELLRETEVFYEGGKRPDEAHSLAMRLEHFLKVCDALAYAHDKGVIHRDLKPANLMLGRHNEVYVMDWGICRVAARDGTGDPAATMTPATSPDATPQETQLGTVVGTPRYMSPEQAQGRTDLLDARSDQCALGLILYELVTFRLPYAGNTPLEVLNAAALGRRRPITHAYRDRVPRELRAIIERATNPEIAQRYPSVRELAADIRRYLRGEAVHAKPDTLWQRLQRAVGRHRQIALASILALLALGLTSQLWLLKRHERETAAAQRHQSRIDAIVTALGRRGDELQTRLLGVQSEIESFAAAAEQQMLHGEPSRERYYLVSDYDDPARAPPDLRVVPGYDVPISMTYSAWSIPDSFDPEAATRTITKLASLRSLRQRLYVRAENALRHGSANAALAPAEERAVVAMMLGLDSGIAAHFPGHSKTEHIDPRTRPWYTIAADRTGTQWGRPFHQSGATATLLPASIRIDGEDDQPIGVASVLLSLHFVSREILRANPVQGVSELVLLDADGVLLASADPASDDTAAIGQPYADAAVLDLVKRGATGHADIQRGETEAIVVIDRVAPFGWALVAIAAAL